VLEASVLLPSHGAVTGWAALRLHGAGLFDGLGPDGGSLLPVSLVIGPGQGRRPRAGIAWCEDRRDVQETLTVHGVPATRVERALFDAMRPTGDVREAVVSLDMAAAAEGLAARRRPPASPGETAGVGHGRPVAGSR
jgi:hypothetical protein